MIFITTGLCIFNVILHYRDTKEAHLAEWGTHPPALDVWKETLKEWWGSIIVAFIAVLFSIFVFALMGFHSYIISINLTTQEKLKHVYDRFPKSPYSFVSCLTDWRKVICCPRRPGSKLSYMLYLKSNEPEKFDKERAERGDDILPDEMREHSIEIHEVSLSQVDRG